MLLSCLIFWLKTHIEYVNNNRFTLFSMFLSRIKVNKRPIYFFLPRLRLAHPIEQRLRVLGLACTRHVTFESCTNKGFCFRPFASKCKHIEVVTHLAISSL